MESLRSAYTLAKSLYSLRCLASNHPHLRVQSVSCQPPDKPESLSYLLAHQHLIPVFAAFLSLATCFVPLMSLSQSGQEKKDDSTSLQMASLRSTQSEENRVLSQETSPLHNALSAAHTRVRVYLHTLPHTGEHPLKHWQVLSTLRSSVCRELSHLQHFGLLNAG